MRNTETLIVCGQLQLELLLEFIEREAQRIRNLRY